jgi:hypothetical protein
MLVARCNLAIPGLSGFHHGVLLSPLSVFTAVSISRILGSLKSGSCDLTKVLLQPRQAGTLRSRPTNVTPHPRSQPRPFPTAAGFTASHATSRCARNADGRQNRQHNSLRKSRLVGAFWPA